MLNVLRDSFKRTPYLKIVLAAVAVSLVLFLGSFFVGGQSSGGRPNWVARVNDTSIPEWRFREVARRLDTEYRELFGQNYEQIKPQLQIRRQVEELLAVTSPERLGTSLSRNLPLTALALERLHVDLHAARLVRLIRDPAPIR